ncbi:type I-F CRISPR-associated protein Csy3 [Parahaliea sp. F7430]|uniref:Type I-F CRISPR-associated protein Csy3 n=1 Tax=Sediminihaliea albiluteola TaxID=2758564 RepID=A0A7W2TU78_9GAMM|nr:type I-F CRISPR-associated protein Csy3 [Sediminihaliea albiluteola]MBA6412059.1 type I-F CRISPR-associated protein Csy3 [Sediminihaliea albiluteola]
MTKNTLKTASVLAFERKIDPSDALLFSGNWSERDSSSSWTPIAVREKSVRGTISNRLKAKDQDPTKVDAAIESPNLQTVDIATLDSEHDTLQVRFTLRVLPGTGTPSACNNADYQEKLAETVNQYVQANGFTELARRYSANLASGRFLWRNRIGSEQVEVSIAHLVDGKAAAVYTFNSLDFSLRNFDHSTEGLEQLSHVISNGLLGKEHVLLQVTAFARVGAGQEVFPSQELILDRGRGDKSKTLYRVNGVAAMHSQKIGNAIRTIDTWYPVEDDVIDLGPIAVEPYGSVTTQGKAYRQPKQKMDFYNLLDNWLLKDQVPALEQQHYVMAILVRGGVFGDAG